MKSISVLTIIIICVFSFWWISRWRARRFLKRWTSPFKEHSQFENVDGVRLHYAVFGDGPNIVLLHGLGANIFCWRLLIPALSKYFKVWAVDLKGFGQSDAPLGSDYGLLAQADLLLKLLVQKKISDAALVGNSMGGAIAAEMAIRKPELVKNLILINPAYDPRMVKINVKPFKFLVPFLVPLAAPFVNRFIVRRFIKGIYGSPNTKVTEDVVDGYIAPYLGRVNNHHTFLQAIDALMDHSLVNRMEKIKIPVLIVGGKNDRVVPISYTEVLHKRLMTSQFVVHPTAGHHIQEEEPDWLANQIRKFIS